MISGQINQTVVKAAKIGTPAPKSHRRSKRIQDLHAKFQTTTGADAISGQINQTIVKAGTSAPKSPPPRRSERIQDLQAKFQTTTGADAISGQTATEHLLQPTVENSDGRRRRHEEGDEQMAKPTTVEEQLLVAIRGYRRLLTETDTRVDGFLDLLAETDTLDDVLDLPGVLDVLIQCLDHNLQAHDLIFEAALVLTIIASNVGIDGIKGIFEFGALKALILLREHPAARVREQVAACFSHIDAHLDGPHAFFCGDDYSNEHGRHEETPWSTDELLEAAVYGYVVMLSPSDDRNPPVDDVLHVGVLPLFIQCLTSNPQAHGLISDAAHALNFLNFWEIRTDGAIKPLISLLHHPDAGLRSDAAMCIETIARDNTHYRDMLLQLQVLEPLLVNIMAKPASMRDLANATFVVYELCRGCPAPAFHLVAPAIPYLKEIFEMKGVPKEIHLYAVWALDSLYKNKERTESSSSNRSP